MDFVRQWSEAAEIGLEAMLGWIGLSSRKFRDWRAATGRSTSTTDWFHGIIGQPLAKLHAQRPGIQPTGGTARSLAHRLFLRERGGNVLLSLQPTGWLFAMGRALGTPGIDEGGRCGAGSETGGGPGTTAGEPSEGEAGLVNKSHLAMGLGRVYSWTVDPEGTGSAGKQPERRGQLEYRRLGRRSCRPGRPPAGSISKRKIPGGSGDGVP